MKNWQIESAKLQNRRASGCACMRRTRVYWTRTKRRIWVNKGTWC